MPTQIIDGEKSFDPIHAVVDKLGKMIPVMLKLRPMIFICRSNGPLFSFLIGYRVT
jgi:hypothetical protein